MERTLILMRHAKSDWSRDVADLQRPIGKRGRRQAREGGAWLARHQPGIDFVVTSPARRARSTWEEAATEYGDVPHISTDKRIYTLDDADLLAVLRDIDDDIESTVLIGHNPGMDELAHRLTGAPVEMVTSALAVMTFDCQWSELRQGTCTLTAYGRPPQA